MVNLNFFEYVLNLRFLIMFGLVGATFLPIAYSFFLTWFDNQHKVDNLMAGEKKRRADIKAERRRRKAERRRRQRVRMTTTSSS